MFYREANKYIFNLYYKIKSYLRWKIKHRIVFDSALFTDKTVKDMNDDGFIVSKTEGKKGRRYHLCSYIGKDAIEYQSSIKAPKLEGIKLDNFKKSNE